MSDKVVERLSAKSARASIRTSNAPLRLDGCERGGVDVLNLDSEDVDVRRKLTDALAVGQGTRDRRAAYLQTREICGWMVEADTWVSNPPLSPSPVPRYCAPLFLSLPSA
eukprot:scaffold151817_cov24-Tisochrysis_lutea.AAC.4